MVNPPSKRSTSFKKIKADAKSVFSNIGGGAHGHIGLVLADAKYALIFNTPSIYPTHQGPLIILYGTTAYMNSNMIISHTKEVRLFRELTGVEQAFVQHIYTTVKKAYLMDVRNLTTNSVNDTMDDVLMRLQDNYGKLMPHELHESEGIVNKTTCHP